MWPGEGSQHGSLPPSDTGRGNKESQKKLCIKGGTWEQVGHLITEPEVYAVVINLRTVVGLEQSVDDKHRDGLQDEGGEEVHVDIVAHAVQLAGGQGSQSGVPVP